jgi:NifU-like protein involved in Fe-S cluster formation
MGCSGMTHSAAMAAEVLTGKTILEAINTAMRELFLQIVYGRSQTAFSEGGLPIGAGLEDLGKGLRSQIGTMCATKAKGTRSLDTMGLIGMGNNPMVGASVAVAVAVSEAMRK